MIKMNPKLTIVNSSWSDRSSSTNFSIGSAQRGVYFDVDINPMRETRPLHPTTHLVVLADWGWGCSNKTGLYSMYYGNCANGNAVALGNRIRCG